MKPTIEQLIFSLLLIDISARENTTTDFVYGSAVQLAEELFCAKAEQHPIVKSEEQKITDAQLETDARGIYAMYPTSVSCRDRVGKSPSKDIPRIKALIRKYGIRDVERKFNDYICTHPDYIKDLCGAITAIQDSFMEDAMERPAPRKKEEGTITWQ